MDTTPLPTLFISHGAPTIPLEDVPAKKFWEELGNRFHGVRAVLSVSAHWESSRPIVSAVRHPETIHDFYGFPRPLYEIEYPAPGAPDVAARVSSLLRAADLSHEVDRSRGLDHGTWVPLRVMFPKADVPVLQLSIQHHLDPAQHLALGRALAPLRSEEVLVIGSGGAVHPLGYGTPLAEDAPPEPWAVAFYRWLTSAVVRGAAQELVDYSTLAPHPERAHPRPDHYVPLLTALGAAGVGAKGTVIHESWYWGMFSMAAYEFQTAES
jgi:4,5-DOPA dioxygenase extradiol